MWSMFIHRSIDAQLTPVRACVVVSFLVVHKSNTRLFRTLFFEFDKFLNFFLILQSN